MSRTHDSDKRRYIRYEVLDYALARVDDVRDAIRAVIVDIGLGGLQIRTRESMPVGAVCHVEVGRFDRDPIVLRGEVRHAMPVADSDLVAIGLRFLPENHEERMTIAEFVHSVFQRQCDLLAM